MMMKTKIKVRRLERGVNRDPVALSLRLFKRKLEPTRKPYSRKRLANQGDQR